MPRYRALDGVRGIAITAVLANHTGSSLGKGGYLGVDLFFVLSGYLITTILLNERQRTGGISLLRFYGRRALRLYPPLLIVCVIAVAFPDWTNFPNQKVADHSALIAATYTEDLALAFHWFSGAGLEHTWTLAVEEQFYLLWPTALFLATVVFGVSRRWLMTTLLACLAYSITALIVLHAWKPHAMGGAYRPDVRGGALLLGCLLALALQSPRKVRPSWGWAALVAFVACCALSRPVGTWSAVLISIPVTWLASAVLVMDLVTRRRSTLARALSFRPLAYIGLVSYGLYLYHVLILNAVSSHTTLPRHESAPLAVVLAIAAASLSYHFIEMPFLRLKSRLEPVVEGRRSQLPVTADF